MSERAERPNRWPWPPIVYTSATLAALGLSFVLPLPWFGSPIADILFAAGVIAMLGAIALDLAAMNTLARGKTTIWPNRRSEHLVHAGPFTFTRNPIYLGNTTLMIGAGLAFGLIWFVVLAFVAAFITQKIAIEREEAHLDARFGKAYRDYRKKVRRWI